MITALIGRRYRNVLAVSALLVAVLVPASAFASSRGSQCGKLAGSWYVDTLGAPFHAHLFAFEPGGILVSTNPDAAEALNSSSAGIGVYRGCSGRFLEVNADKLTNRYTSTLSVTFQVTAVTDGRFTAPATATYFDGDGRLVNGPFPATLVGQRITLDSPSPVVAP